MGEQRRTALQTRGQLFNVEYGDFDALVDQSLDCQLSNSRAAARDDGHLAGPVPPCSVAAEPSCIQGDMVQLLVENPHCAKSKAYFQRFYNQGVARRIAESGDAVGKVGAELQRAFCQCPEEGGCYDWIEGDMAGRGGD